MQQPPSTATARPAASTRKRLLLNAAAASVFLAATSVPVPAQATGLLCTLLPLFCGPAPAPAPAPTPSPAPAPAPEPPPPPQSLKGQPVPTPDNLAAYIANKDAAIRLGKALFWDMQVGSDGKTACASCHFHAGADTRSKNQVSPGLTRQSSLTAFDADSTFQLGGPNYQAQLSDFPFHKLSNPHDRNSTVLRSINDTFTSQGVFNERFTAVSRGAAADQRSVTPDPIFHVGASITRRVEPRNTPTVVNAVFNFRNFWDGRAQYLFNGVNAFGGRDPNARVYKTGGTWNGTGPTLSALTCGSEWGQDCKLPAGLTTRVWYGANGSWREKDRMSGSFACTNTTFGGDPAPGATKACLYEPEFAPPTDAPSCAQEGGTCSLPAGMTTNVWYGAQTSWRVRPAAAGSMACNSATFGGDPLPGVTKLCRFEATPSANLAAVKIRLNKASLASQASGPPLSDFEMSAAGRGFMDLGKRVLGAQPLKLQRVHGSDSVLGAFASATTGLNVATYEDMVRAAFKAEWWNGSQVVQVDAAGNRTLLPPQATLAANQYNHMQANFSLVFSLALQMYQATLVSDDTPFDRHLSGTPSLTASQAQGMSVFFGKGKCANCHGGPEFTNASVRQVLKEGMSRMVMGNGGTAAYDEGYYNIAVTKTLEDIINGGVDPARNPISLTGLLQKLGPQQFQTQIGIPPNLSLSATERIAVNGAAKTPGLRNVELTAPYFHNGGSATLRQVVEFYNRGGNFANNNIADLDADIQPLGLSEDEIRSLVDFLKSLTDDRVRYSAAPFDHPQLLVPNGHVGDTASVASDGAGRAQDAMLEIAATGAAGYTSDKASTPANFLGTAASGSPWVRLQWVGASNQCMRSLGAGLHFVTAACAEGDAAQEFRVVPAASGGHTLVSRLTGQVVGVDSTLVSGAYLRSQGQATGNVGQAWNVQESNDGVRLYNQGAQRCVSPWAATAGSVLGSFDCSLFSTTLTGVDRAGFRMLPLSGAAPGVNLASFDLTNGGNAAFQLLSWQVSTSVRITAVNGYSGNVALVIPSLPPFLTASISPSVVPAGGTATVTFRRTLWRGVTVPVTVNANGGGITKATTVNVSY
jgi:cytochrome c peroxidase